MNLSLIRSMTRSAVFELENGKCFRPEHPFAVALNGKTIYESCNTNVFSLFSLTPSTTYTVEVDAEGEHLKLDFTTEEFATFADDQELSEEAIEAVQAVFSYISEKKQQTTVQTLLKLSRLPKKEPKTFENFDFSLLKSRDLDRIRALPSLGAVYSHRNRGCGQNLGPNKATGGSACTLMSNE